tara:strand:+ start:545 stop:874 length:330 start_codon:yes stop_codon:yes gene_type:complete
MQTTNVNKHSFTALLNSKTLDIINSFMYNKMMSKFFLLIKDYKVILFLNLQESIMSNKDVLIASKVPSTFREEVQVWCEHHDITLSQAIRKGLTEYMKKVNETFGEPQK